MKILKIKEHKNGNSTLTYELTSREIKMFTKVAKSVGKEYSKEFANEMILKALRRIK